MGYRRHDPTDPDVITIPEAARRLGVSNDKAYQLAHAGQLPGAILVGSIWRVSVRRLERHLHGEPTPAPPEAPNTYRDPLCQVPEHAAGGACTRRDGRVLRSDLDGDCWAQAVIDSRRAILDGSQVAS